MGGAVPIVCTAMGGGIGATATSICVGTGADGEDAPVGAATDADLVAAWVHAEVLAAAALIESAAAVDAGAGTI